MSTTDRIDELRKKFDENPRRYFAPLANEYRKAGDLLQAIGLCREHLPKQPGHMSGYIVFGQALYESGELTEAQSVFEQALALDPENLIALRHLGDIARDVGDDSTARRWYSRVLDADPRNDDIVAQLATLSASRTPASGPIVPSFDALTKPSETPAFAMDAIGLAAVPTPDSVMRAVDLDGWAARPPHHSPIDLEAVAPPEPATATPVAALAPIDLEDHAESPADHVDFIAEVAHGIPTSPSSVPAVPSLVDDDPFEFPQAATDQPAELLAGHEDVFSPDAPFEEGLVAPEWTDTASVVSQIVTPRDTVVFTPARSIEVQAEARAAFGHEESDPIAAFAAPLSQPVSEVTSTPAALDDIFAAAEEPAEAPAEHVTASWSDHLVAEHEPVGAEASVESLFEQEDHPAFEAPVDAVAPSEDVFPWMGVPDEPMTEMAGENESLTDAIAGDGHHEADEIMAAFGDPSPAEDADLSSAVDNVVPIESLQYDVSSAAPHEFEHAFDGQPSLQDSFDQHAYDDEETSADATFVTPPSSPAFVTETMAELLVSQGFVDRAAEVYDELVQRHPYDPTLASRRDEVRAMCRPVVAEAESMASGAFASGAFASATPAQVTPVSVPSFTETATPSVASYATPSIPLSVATVSATPPMAPYAQPTAESDAPPPRLAREWFAALAARRVPRRTPSQAAAAVPQSPEGLSSLFGADAATHDDVAARALADAFAPIPEEELAAGTALDFSFASPTPAFSPAVARHTPSAPIATQEPVFSQRESASRRPPPAVGNAGFAFDKFFPDPAARRNTPVEPTPAPPATPVADDLAQFSSWLKGLGQT